MSTKTLEVNMTSTLRTEEAFLLLLFLFLVYAISLSPGDLMGLIEQNPPKNNGGKPNTSSQCCSVVFLL